MDRPPSYKDALAQKTMTIWHRRCTLDSNVLNRRRISAMERTKTYFLCNEDIRNITTVRSASHPLSKSAISLHRIGIHSSARRWNDPPLNARVNYYLDSNGRTSWQTWISILYLSYKTGWKPQFSCTRPSLEQRQGVTATMYLPTVMSVPAKTCRTKTWKLTNIKAKKAKPTWSIRLSDSLDRVHSSET